MSSNADWQELHCTARKDQIDALEEWFFAAGALSVTLEDQADQPLLEPGPGETPLWDAVRVTALFAGGYDLQPVLAAFPKELVTEAPEKVVLVADREWTRVWEDQFQPMQMGERLWVCPSWTPPSRARRGESASRSWSRFWHRHAPDHRYVFEGTGRGAPRDHSHR